MKVIQENPRATREELVRQQVRPHIEAHDLGAALQCAEELTDVFFIDNQQKKECKVKTRWAQLRWSS